MLSTKDPSFRRIYGDRADNLYVFAFNRLFAKGNKFNSYENIDFLAEAWDAIYTDSVSLCFVDKHGDIFDDTQYDEFLELSDDDLVLALQMPSISDIVLHNYVDYMLS